MKPILTWAGICAALLLAALFFPTLSKSWQGGVMVALLLVTNLWLVGRMAKGR